MNLMAFQKLRDGVRANGAPTDPRTLAKLERRLRADLRWSRAFKDIEVGVTDDGDGLLVALCTFEDGITEDAVVTVLENLWNGIRFDHWESHAFIEADGHVELEAASLSCPSGQYVTVHLVARREVASVAAATSRLSATG